MLGCGLCGRLLGRLGCIALLLGRNIALLRGCIILLNRSLTHSRAALVANISFVRQLGAAICAKFHMKTPLKFFWGSLI